MYDFLGVVRFTLGYAKELSSNFPVTAMQLESFIS